MTNTSNHFSLEEWADYGRGRSSAEDRARMEQHLQKGCPACSRTLALWTGVLETASREDTFEPPKDVLRCAKALYSAFPAARSQGLSLRIAQLAGFGQPAMEGVRAAGAPGTHFLFRHNDLMLDMRIESKPASNAVSVRGQVVDASQLNVRLDNRAVSVLRQADALARTTTNEYGEFSLEFKPEEDLVLIIELENKSYLVSHLPAPKK
jgi:anti-sigma factor RsiW